MPPKKFSRSLAVPVRNNGGEWETVHEYELISISMPFVDPSLNAVGTTAVWRETLEAWRAVRAPYDKLRLFFDALKHGVCFELRKPSGILQSSCMNADIGYFSSTKAYARYLICFHCGILDRNMNQGASKRSNLKDHIDRVHRWAPILFFACSGCSKRFEECSELVAHRDEIGGTCYQDKEIQLSVDYLFFPKETIKETDLNQPYYKCHRIKVKYPYTDINGINEVNPHQTLFDAYLDGLLLDSKAANQAGNTRWSHPSWISQQTASENELKEKKVTLGGRHGNESVYAGHLAPWRGEINPTKLNSRVTAWDKKAAWSQTKRTKDQNRVRRSGSVASHTSTSSIVSSRIVGNVYDASDSDDISAIDMNFKSEVHDAKLKVGETSGSDESSKSHCPPVSFSSLIKVENDRSGNRMESNEEDLDSDISILLEDMGCDGIEIRDFADPEKGEDEVPKYTTTEILHSVLHRHPCTMNKRLVSELLNREGVSELPTYVPRGKNATLNLPDNLSSILEGEEFQNSLCKRDSHETDEECTDLMSESDILEKSVKEGGCIQSGTISKHKTQIPKKLLNGKRGSESAIASDSKSSIPKKPVKKPRVTLLLGDSEAGPQLPIKSSQTKCKTVIPSSPKSTRLRRCLPSNSEDKKSNMIVVCPDLNYNQGGGREVHKDGERVKPTLKKLSLPEVAFNVITELKDGSGLKGFHNLRNLVDYNQGISSPTTINSVKQGRVVRADRGGGRRSERIIGSAVESGSHPSATVNEVSSKERMPALSVGKVESMSKGFVPVKEKGKPSSTVSPAED